MRNEENINWGWSSLSW